MMPSLFGGQADVRHRIDEQVAVGVFGGEVGGVEFRLNAQRGLDH
jgi:hypothetical protein